MGGIVMKQFSLEEYTKNPNRKVVTRAGDPVRILAIDLEDKDFPIAAAIDNRYPLSYTSRGTRNYELRHDDVNDLFFAPEKHEGWINVYEEGTNRYLDGCICVTKEEAKKIRGYGYITTIKIEWEE